MNRDEQIRKETEEHISKTFNEAPSRALELNVRRYMHDKLHCRMSEDPGQGDWVLFSDVLDVMSEIYAALKDAEWSNGGLCPQCGAASSGRHRSKCILNNAIRQSTAFGLQEKPTCAHIWNEYEYEIRCIYCGTKKTSPKEQDGQP